MANCAAMVVDTEAQIAERLEALRAGWTPQEFERKVWVPEERVLILADAHIPYHDEWLLAEAFKRAQEEGVEAVVWLGDLMDMPTQSKFGADDLTTYLQRELDITEGVIREAGKIVRRQYWSRGNHEQRLFKQVGKQAGMRELARMAGLDDLLRSGDLIVSDDPTLRYQTWMFTHPAKYGTTPLVVPGKIADQHRMNVVSAHAHHWGQGMSPSGRFQVVEAGGAFRPERIAYYNYNTTPLRPWVQGYVILDRGQVRLYR